MKTFLTCIMVMVLSSAALAELNTATYVSHDGAGTGSVTGDMSGVGEVTLRDGEGGDMWNGGDQFIYLHEASQRNADFKATVRVVAQTEAIDGRWGKAGIVATSGLDGLSSTAVAQIAAGSGSQFDAPAAGDHSPVPVRLGGRTGNDGQGGFERPILADDDYEGPVFDNAGTFEVANDVFPNTADGVGVRVSWLSLEYNAADNSFVAGYAEDEGGSAGVWNFSAPATDIPNNGDGFYVGLGYSAHNGMAFDQVTDGQHGITFDSFSITPAAVPEPTSIGLALFGFLGMLGFRRRNR